MLVIIILLMTGGYFIMRYSLQSKREIIASKPINTDVRNYCSHIGISCSNYYKGCKELNEKESSL